MDSIAFWNYRGAKKMKASLYMKEFINDYKVFFVGFVETKISSFDRIVFERIMSPNWDFFIISSEGLSGGIMILWRTDIASFSVLKTSYQCVIGDLNVFNKGSWMIVTVYGSKEVHKRRLLWDCIHKQSHRKILAVIGGDFKCILSQEEKRGGRKFFFSQGSLEMFKFMNDNDYHDVGVVGPRYTWCNNKVESGRVLELLDRCLLNSISLQSIQIAVVRHLARVASDYCPIVLKLFDVTIRMRGFIKFEEVWLSFKTSKNIVSKGWKKNNVGDDMEVLNKKCKRTLNELFYWSKNKLKDFLVKRRLKAEILLLQDEEARNGWLDEENLWQLGSKVRELNVILNCLNTWWKQREQVKWVVEGDSNKKFFHAFANARRNANWISQIKNPDGLLTEDPREVEEGFFRFFQDKWKDRYCSLENWPKPWMVLEEDDKILFKKELSEIEVKESVMRLGNNKAPGCDGLTHSFFKSFWEIIGEDVYKAVRFFFSTGKMSKEWKDALVVLIQKSTNPLTPFYYHPLSLCNSIYKIVANVNLNRLVLVFPRIISEEQLAFVKERYISDHLLLAQEIFSKLRYSKACNGYLAIKLDMEQAYNNMCWLTLKKMIMELGFLDRFL
ncbi:hypothetical protein KFK09_024006 [Dendrobium nobile]|uniref:Reverse transcriptase domain-containing protein n=1 Tax=Dendrobium nobile TaxID=94219 RepID=A0A8T3ACK2_DENNO|nr:hypothetical protein KFK09_024006 [Dendrobium nobile]